MLLSNANVESWMSGVLNQKAYFSRTFEEDIAYDNSNRDEFLTELNERESKKIQETFKKTSKLKNFFTDIVDSTNSKSSELKALASEIKFQPRRNYWNNYMDYLTYTLCPFIMQFDNYDLMKNLLKERSGFLCLTAFLLTKIFVNAILTYLIIALGSYHKQCIFHFRYLLPIAKYYPYVVASMVVWSMSVRFDLYSEIFLYFILYFLAEIYIIDLKFTGCEEVLPFPPGVLCFSPEEHYQTRQNCTLVKMQEFIFICHDNKKYLIPDQAILQYMHYDAYFIFWRNLSIGIIFFIILFATGRVYKLLKIVRVALCIRFIVSISLILFSRDVFTTGLIQKLHTEGEWNFATLFKPGGNGFYYDMFNGCKSAFRDVPCLLCVLWGGTSRLAGSPKPVKDSILMTLIDIVCSAVEVLFLLVVYLKAMEETMVWVTPILGFRNGRIPLVPIYIFVRIYSDNVEISMIIILFILVLTHLNALVCEFEALKFSISLINPETYLYANLISIGLTPFFYTFVLTCQIMETAIYTPAPVPRMLTTINSLLSLAFFLVIFFIYSYKRFSYDVEFMTGTKPSKLVPISLCAPIIFLVSMIVLIISQFEPSVDYILYAVVTFCFIVFSTAYVLLNYMSLSNKEFKKKFVPSFFYGPPNHELRKERKLFFQREYSFY